jgi:hypothetical protein
MKLVMCALDMSQLLAVKENALIVPLRTTQAVFILLH